MSWQLLVLSLPTKNATARMRSWRALKARDAVPRLDRAAYCGRVWATRRRPWVDRLASAWLIRRLIDTDARFLWLQSPADCPKTALGLDFDGATFSHLGQRVTFAFQNEGAP